MKKQIFILLILTLMSLKSFSLERPLKSFSCVTELTTTSFLLNLKNENYILDVLHHNGTEHAPFYDGLVTLATLDYLQANIVNMKKLGSRITFKFKKEDCSRLNKNRITCSQQGKLKLGPLAVKSVSLNIYESSKSSSYGVFNTVHASLHYHIGSRSFRVPMNFPVKDCSTIF